MKELHVDLAELGFVFEDASWEANHYLDLETGDIIMITKEMRRQLDELSEANFGEAIDLSQVIEDLNLVGWEKEAVLEAYRVEESYGTRYIAIPTADSREGYRDMERFISTVEDQHLRRPYEVAVPFGVSRMCCRTILKSVSVGSRSRSSGWKNGCWIDWK